MAVICGIYIIECTITGERYVGSSEDVDRRWSTHRSQLKRGIHHSPLLQARWKEHGAESLSYRVVEIVASEILIERETEYIKSGDFACNAAFPMRNPMKGRMHSPASLELMSKNRRGIPGPWPKGAKRPKEFGEAVSRGKKGKTHKGSPLSPEAAAKATARLRAAGNDHWIGRKHSPEARKKMVIAASNREAGHYHRGSDHQSFGLAPWNKGVPAKRRGEASAAKSVEIAGAVYPSLMDAADALGLCVSTLHKRRQRGALEIRQILV